MDFVGNLLLFAAVK